MSRPKAAYPWKFFARAIVAGKMRMQGVALCNDTCPTNKPMRATCQCNAVRADAMSYGYATPTCTTVSTLSGCALMNSSYSALVVMSLTNVLALMPFAALSP